MDGQNRRVEVAAEGRVAGPNIKVDLHPRGRVQLEGCRGFPLFTTHLHTIDQPSDVGGSPFERVRVIVTAQIAGNTLDPTVVGDGRPVKRVGLHSTIRSKLLEIELVPERTRDLRARLPQE